MGLGVLMGFASIVVTRAVYAVEDGFDRLPLHWMWWPALGAVAVGVIGYFVPRTLGVGYDFMSSTIMTEKIARRGVAVPSDYVADFLSQVPVRETGGKSLVALSTESTLGSVRSWLDSDAPGSQHGGFPVLDANGDLAGVLTRRDPLDAHVADAARQPARIVTRSNLLAARRRRLLEASRAETSLKLW